MYIGGIILFISFIGLTGNKYILTFEDKIRNIFLGGSNNIEDYKESQNYYIVVKNDITIDIKGKSDEMKD